MSEVQRLSAIAKRLNALGANVPQSGSVEELIIGIEQAVQSLSVKFSSGSSSGPAPSAGASQAFDAFVEIVDGALQNYLNLSKKIGGLVGTQALEVEKAFLSQKEFLSHVVQSKEPDSQTLQALLTPLSQSIASIQDVKEKNRSEKILFNHLAAVSEGIPALGWVTVSPKPAPHVMQMKDAAEFYSNRVLKEYKDKDQTHKDWSQSFPKLLLELHDFVKKYYTTGLTWGGAKIVTASTPTPTPTPASTPTPKPASTPASTPAPKPVTSSPTPAPAPTATASAPQKKTEDKPKPSTETPKAKELSALIERLEKNDATLKEINISGNEASSPDFGVRIGNALKQNTHLQKLFMSASRQNCTSAAALAEGLKVNKSVEVFHIETNEIAAEGTNALAGAIKANSTVTEWKMANQATYSGIETERAIASAFDVNQTIVKFTFHGKDIGVSSIIERFLARNAELARQKKRAAAGSSTPVSSTATTSQSSGTDTKAPVKTEPSAPTGVMGKYLQRLEENDPTLTDLELSKNAVCSAKHGALFGKALAKNTHLKKLLLDGTLQDNESAIEIAKGLRQNHTLEVLSLEENDIGPEGLKALAEALAENNALLELRLRSQKKPAGVEAEKAFQLAMEKNESLIKFSCQFKDPGVMNYVNRGITRNTEKARQKRAESTPKIHSGPHMTAIQNAITSLKNNDANAVEINLNDNLVCNLQFTKEIAGVLEKNTRTKKLYLDSTSQNNDSSSAIFKALKVNKSLEVLSIEHNDIGPEGFKVLAEVLVENSTLVEIRINHQKKPIGNEAERLIAEALDKNKTVCKFSITVKDLGVRTTIDRILTRNAELARTKRSHA